MIEAMKQALENELSASDFIDKAPQSWDKTERTEWARLQAMLHNIRAFKKAMRQAIAEAEKQEPVAVQMDVIVVNLVREGINKHRARELAEHFIKHTHPQPKREPMTDEQIEDLYFDGFSISKLKDFARAIEAAHGIKEKNT